MPEHTFFFCSRSFAKKLVLDTELGTTLTPNNFQKTFLANKLHRIIIQKYIKEIILIKSLQYRNPQHSSPLPPSPAKDIHTFW